MSLEFLEKLNHPTGIVFITLLSAIVFAALGQTLPAIPFHESHNTMVVAYGIISICVYLIWQYRVFFQPYKRTTRYQLITINYTRGRRIWTGILIILGSAYLSYMIGYVLSKAMYLPHKLVADRPIQQKFSIEINPYTTGVFRNYARIHLINQNYSSLDFSWPKENLLQFDTIKPSTPTIACISLQQSVFGTSINSITPCS